MQQIFLEYISPDVARRADNGSWRKGLYQFCKEAVESGEKKNKEKYEPFLDRLGSDDYRDIKIEMLDITILNALILYGFDDARRMRDVDKQVFRYFVRNFVNFRNREDHLTVDFKNNNESYEMALCMRPLVNIVDFTEFIEKRDNRINENNLNKFKELKNEAIRIMNDIYDNSDRISARLVGCAVKAKQSFERNLAKFIMLDAEEYQEDNSRLISSFNVSYVDEILDDYSYSPRRGKIDNILDSLSDSDEGSKVLLVGGPGVGKTTSMNYLAYRDACIFEEKNESDFAIIPVVIPLKNLMAPSETIENCIVEETGLRAEEVKYLLKDGRINLYLDAINELPDLRNSDTKQLRIREINELASKYPKLQVVCSTRESERRQLSGFACFRVLPMDSEMLIEYVEKNARDQESKNLILDALRNDEQYIAGISTPLYISRLLDVVYVSRVIPASTSLIIGEYINCLLDREIREKNVQFDKNKMINMLVEFAYRVRNKYNSNCAVPYDAIIDVFTEKGYYNRNECTRFADMCIELDILSQSDMINDRYSFEHETYQEYFRAKKDDFIL